MLMEAPNYPVMCIARVLQGVGSSMVWVVGLALLYALILHTCEKTAEQKIDVTPRLLQPLHVILVVAGKNHRLNISFPSVHIGFAMSGLSVG